MYENEERNEEKKEKGYGWIVDYFIWKEDEIEETISLVSKENTQYFYPNQLNHV